MTAYRRNWPGAMVAMTLALMAPANGRGKPIGRADLAGRVVVVEFWAT